MRKAYSYIRFSTKGQIEGRSLQRQMESAAEFAASNDLELQSTSYQDLGVSGYTGRNTDDGALGQFIEAVRSGHIEKGSWLLIESFDRMSRQPVEEALGLLMELVKLEITVVTLMDRQVYRKGQLDMTQLIISLVTMSRAHEESATKSRRLSDVWSKKKAQAAVKPMGSPLPAWLLYNEDKSVILIDEAKAAVVRYIFELSANGWGRSALIRKLNDDGVKHISTRSTRWHSSYIAKILNGKAVLGEYQPHTTVNGRRREVVGSVIENYYPPIIDRELWLRSQAGMQSRKQGATGTVKKGFTKNVLTGIVKCECGESMQFLNKGNPPKGGNYLVCGAARYGASCRYVGHRYEAIQALVLTALQELLVQFDKASEKDSRKLALEGERQELQKQSERLVEAIATVGGSAALLERLKATESRMVAVDKDLMSILQEKAVGETDRASLTDLAKNLGDQVVRLKLNQFLRRSLEKVVLHKDRSRIEIKVRDGEDISLTFNEAEGEWCNGKGWLYSVRKR